MGVDINAVRSILGVNNLTPESPEEAIRAALVAANYKPEEIKIALQLLTQPQAQNSASQEVPAERKTKIFPGFGVEHTVSGVNSGAKIAVQKQNSVAMGMFATIVILIVIGVAVYHSGVLRYAAQVTGMDVFCAGIVDPTVTDACYSALKPISEE